MYNTFEKEFMQYTFIRGVDKKDKSVCESGAVFCWAVIFVCGLQIIMILNEKLQSGDKYV